MIFRPELIEWTIEPSGTARILRVIGRYPGGFQDLNHRYTTSDAGVIEHCKNKIQESLYKQWCDSFYSEYLPIEEASDPEYDRYDQEE